MGNFMLVNINGYIEVGAMPDWAYYLTLSLFFIFLFCFVFLSECLQSD